MPVHSKYTDFIDNFSKAIFQITGHHCSCSLRRAGTAFVLHWKLIETGEYGTFRVENEEIESQSFPVEAAENVKRQIDWLDSIEKYLEGAVNGGS